MKVTNLGKNPVTIYCGGVSMAIAGGGSVESDNFTDTEIAQYRRYPEAFGIEGDMATGGDPDLIASNARLADALNTIRDHLGVENTGADVAPSIIEAIDAERQKLKDIADLFGTDEVDTMNVKAAVERLLQDAVADSADPAPSPLTLAEAISSLDDANDDHWTQAGLPDISTLKTLTGADVTRAMVDQLPDGDKRERAK